MTSEQMVLERVLLADAIGSDGAGAMREAYKRALTQAHRVLHAQREELLTAIDEATESRPTTTHDAKVEEGEAQLENIWRDCAAEMWAIPLMGDE